MSIRDALATPAVATAGARKETLEEGAARLGLSVEDAQAVRDSIGQPLSELASVTNTEHGVVVTKVRSAAQIFRSADNPDANGNHGWLLYRGPAPVINPDGPAPPVPVFVAPEDAADEEPARPAKAKPAAKKASS